MARAETKNGTSPIIPAPEPEEVIAQSGWHGNIPFVPAQFTLDSSGVNAKFTLSLKSSGEISLTIRTDDESELEQLLEKWEPRLIIITEPNGKPKYYPGDSCPRCSSKLIRRQGQRGKFVGCSGFPECAFTAPL